MGSFGFSGASFGVHFEQTPDENLRFGQIYWSMGVFGSITDARALTFSPHVLADQVLLTPPSH